MSPSQSLSKSSHTSCAPGLIAASPSLQSTASLKPSPSPSVVAIVDHIFKLNVGLDVENP